MFKKLVVLALGLVVATASYIESYADVDVDADAEA